MRREYFYYAAGFLTVATNLSNLSSCKKSVKIRRVETWHFTDLLQLVETTCSQPVDNKFTESTCNKSVDNLQQTCRQQVVAIHTNAS